MKKFLDIAITTLFVLLMLGINIVVCYGVVWEIFLSPNEPQWVDMIVVSGGILLLDLALIRFHMD